MKLGYGKFFVASLIAALSVALVSDNRVGPQGDQKIAERSSSARIALHAQSLEERSPVHRVAAKPVNNLLALVILNLGRS